MTRHKLIDIICLAATRAGCTMDETRRLLLATDGDFYVATSDFTSVVDTGRRGQRFAYCKCPVAAAGYWDTRPVGGKKYDCMRHRGWTADASPAVRRFASLFDQIIHGMEEARLGANGHYVEVVY